MKNIFFKSLKHATLFAFILFSSIACEKDFEDIGVSLVDNNLFSTLDTSFEIKAYHQNITKSRVDLIPEHLIGIYKDLDNSNTSNFGEIKASFISQLSLPIDVEFGDNVSIDTIILDIPYYSTKKEKNSDGTPNFKLDSIQGNGKFILSIHELGTFLNALDPLDPTKRRQYHSNEDFTKKTLLYSGEFKPNNNDTVLYVKRSFFENEKSVDTIKKEKLSPSIKIPLDTTFFRTNFIDKDNDASFSSLSNFIDYFRGIYIDVDEINGEKGSLLTLKMSNANITVYYTNDVLTDEKENDLNGDGDTDDKDVPVRTKQTKVYPVKGVMTNKYNRDYTGTGIQNYISNDNTLTLGDEKKMFIQGASGSMTVLDLFNGLTEDDFDAIKQENWLINEANITLYVDETSGDNVPEKLLLYNYDNNSQLIDVYAEAKLNGIGGKVDKEDGKPVKYKFRITNYIKKVLKSDKPMESLNRVGLKILNSSDIPDFTTLTDTLITNFSWISKGVVLKGNKLPNINGKKDPQRLKLEIFYTK